MRHSEKTVLSQDKEEIRDNTSVYRGFLMQYCAKMAILRRFITMVHRPSTVPFYCDLTYDNMQDIKLVIRIVGIRGGLLFAFYTSKNLEHALLVDKTAL